MHVGKSDILGGIHNTHTLKQLMGSAEAMSAINPTSLQGSGALIQHQTGIQSTDILRDLGRQLKPCKKLMLHAVLSLSLC